MALFSCGVLSLDICIRKIGNTIMTWFIYMDSEALKYTLAVITVRLLMLTDVRSQEFQKSTAKVRDWASYEEQCMESTFGTAQALPEMFDCDHSGKIGRQH